MILLLLFNQSNFNKTLLVNQDQECPKVVVSIRGCLYFVVLAQGFLNMITSLKLMLRTNICLRILYLKAIWLI